MIDVDYLSFRISGTTERLVCACVSDAGIVYMGLNSVREAVRARVVPQIAVVVLPVETT